MSAAFNKVNAFVQDLGRKVHNLNADTLKLALFTAAAAPTASDATYDDSGHTLNSSGSAELVNGNGYTSNGYTIPSTAYSQTAGTATLTGIPANPTWTSNTGNMVFRYIAIYNLTAGSAGLRPLIGFWDYGATLTLDGTKGDTFTVSFAGNSILTLA